MWSEELLEQFLLIASEELNKDWVLCGASILPLLGVKTRTTWDIDLFGLGTPSQEESFRMMEIVENLGIPAECVNLSGGYYLSKIKDYRKHLIPLQSAKVCIYRPDVYLFSRLKLQRFSEVDLLDCQDYFSFTADEDGELANKFKTHLIEELAKTNHPDRAKRIVQMMNHIS